MNAINFLPGSANWKRKARRSSKEKNWKMIERKDSGGLPIKSSDTTDVQSKLVSALMAQKDPSINT
jgi:hypothetical protein